MSRGRVFAFSYTIVGSTMMLVTGIVHWCLHWWAGGPRYVSDSWGWVLLGVGLSLLAAFFYGCSNGGGEG